MSGATAMGANKITGLTNAVLTTLPAYGQIPTALPPNVRRRVVDGQLSESYGRDHSEWGYGDHTVSG